MSISKDSYYSQLQLPSKWQVVEDEDTSLILSSSSGERIFVKQTPTTNGSAIRVTYQPHAYDATRLVNRSKRSLCETWQEAIETVNDHIN